MKKVIAVLILAALFSFTRTLNASEETHKKITEELIKVMKVEEMENQGFEQLKQIFMSQTDKIFMALGDEAKTKSVKEKYTVILNKELSWENLKSEYIKLYMETFTEKEMEEIIAFIKSPAGQKFMDKTPELMDRSSLIGEKKITEIMLKIGNPDRGMDDGKQDQQKKEMPKNGMHMQKNK